MPHLREWSISRLMSTAARMLEYNWNAKLQALGLTHAGVMALDTIDREGSLTQTQVAAKVGVQAQTMGKTLTRLESHGHIARLRNTVDRRSYLMVITEKGKQALAQAQEVERDLAGTGVLDHGELREALEQVIRDLSNEDTMPLQVVEQALGQLPGEDLVVAQELSESAAEPEKKDGAEPSED